MKKVLAIASLIMTMAAGANATTVNLMKGGDLDVSGGVGTFEVDGVKGTITAHSIGSYSPRISQGDDGIGVRSGYFDDTRDLDGFFDEWLTFGFEKAVRLVSVTMGHVDRNDDWDVYVGTTKIANESSQNPFYFGNVIAKSFSILADGHKCRDGYRRCRSTDNFVIKGFEVALAPVPLPATGLLLIGGLAGFGLMRRRRKHAA
ncbi:MAG: VPLPA-CTERM sorting domain-containing protein [Paracoccaceae bacterium]